MKISNASKKVLASALSAAMVVAFAPAVAMADISYGTQVNVKFDLNKGSLPSGSAVASVADGTGTASVDGKTLTVVADANSFNGASATKDGAQFAGWFYDADDNGEYDASKGDVAYNATAGTLDVTTIAQTSEITLKAKYAYAKEMTATDSVVNTAAGTSDTTVAFNVDGDVTSGYTFEGVGPDGATINGTAGTVSNSKTPVSFDLAGHLGSGTYTFSVKDASKTVVAQATLKLVEVSLDAAGFGTFAASDATKYYVTSGTQVKDLAKLTVPTAAGSATFVGYYNADGDKITAAYTSGTTVAADNSATAEIKKDTTYTAVWSNAQVTKATYADDVLTFGVQKPADENAIQDYTATVTGPNGFAKTWNIAKTNIASPTLSFGQTFEGVAAEGGAAYKTKDAAAAGTYTLSIVANATEAAQNAGTEMPAIASKSVDVVAVTFDIDGGTWTGDVTKKDSAEKAAYDAVVKLYQADKKAVSEVKTAASGLLPYVKAPEGKVVDAENVTYNGVKGADVKSTDKVGASGLVVKAAYKDGVAAPTLASKTADGTKYKMVFTATAGKIQYSTNNGSSWYNLPSDGTITVSNSQQLKVKAVDASGNSSEILTYKPYADAVSAFDTFAVSALNAKTAESTNTVPVTYGSVLKTAKADGEKALKEIGYAEQGEWAAEVVKQEKAVVEAMAKHATDKLAEAKTLTASKDGKTYSYITDATYQTAVAAIDATVAAFDANNDKDYTNDVKVNKKSANILGADYAADITKAGTDAAKVTVAADDAKAAIAVTDAIAKIPAEITAANAAEAKAAAEAAVKAYGELSATAKNLVSSADYAKATAAIAAADEAVATADKAAVAKVKGKTVKAKASKKTTAKLTKVTSESGTVSTFKKTSGNAKITVSKSGKITVKKGLKKGKKYTAKVKATIGASTKTVKVVVKVTK